MIVGVATEGIAAERRVALVPLSVRELARADLEVVVQRGAGLGAGYPDADYERRGARLLTDAAEVVSNADILVCVGPDGLRADALRGGQIVIGLIDPVGSPATMQQLAASGVTSFALELLPRITRAQSMDALSSMATVAGYKAALLGASELGKMFPMMITAAGTLARARDIKRPSSPNSTPRYTRSRSFPSLASKPPNGCSALATGPSIRASATAISAGRKRRRSTPSS